MIRQMKQLGIESKFMGGDGICTTDLPKLAGGAMAVDMESVWLAAGAAERPFAVVRVVLDSPSHELLRVQAVGGALRAASSLRKVAAALHAWAPED